MKGHWPRVNLVKREALLKDLHATSVLSFPLQTKKSVLQYLYLCYSDGKPMKSRKKKSMSIFLSHDQCLSLENICHIYASLQANDIGM